MAFGVHFWPIFGVLRLLNFEKLASSVWRYTKKFWRTALTPSYKDIENWTQFKIRLFLIR